MRSEQAKCVAKTLAFFKSVIICSEPWSKDCENQLDRAIAALTDLDITEQLFIQQH